jgi:predicted enzyme related to lactoylglutathione lyase
MLGGTDPGGAESAKLERKNRREGDSGTSQSLLNSGDHCDRAPMTGEVGHFEIPADNTERARKFYSATFGWKATAVPGMDYTMVSTGPVDERGMPSSPGHISGGIGTRAGPLEHPVVTIVVDDLVAAEKQVEKNGGRIIQRRQPIGDGSMGFTGYFKDTEGNVVGLYEWPKQ